MIKWITALCEPCHEGPPKMDGSWWESSHKTWSTGEGNGKPFQHSCLENSMNSIKRQNHRTLKNELPRSIGAQYAAGEKWRSNSRMKRWSQSTNNTQLWMLLVMEVKSDAINNNIA